MQHRRLTRSAAFAAAATSLALLAAPAAAQATNPLLPVAYEHDSGPAANEGRTQDVVLSFLVEYPGVDSLQLHFSEVQLAGSIAAGTHSELHLTSLLDGAQQRMNAVHVEQWQSRSAYFNGDAVLVEVVAQPGTGPNRVAVESLLVGFPTGLPETQCGPTDDRVPSNDPRVCRLMPVACTAWMIDDCGKCFLSAGHCGGGGGSSVQFNVPFSQPNGSLVFPPPEDQYAVDGASYQFQNSTDDWQYFGVFPNSNTGLTPYQAQGDAFDLATPPTPAGNNIRITGHGTDSTPNSTYNQIQQTSVGPFVSSGTNLNYQADTTGGSSGSPVIWEEMDVAIGVHTNGGCSTSGSGSNNGTPITAVALQNALANPKGVCKIGDNMADLGQAKPDGPFARPPTLTACGSLTPGNDVETLFDLLVPPGAVGLPATAILFIGTSELSMPFLGGVLVPNPDFALIFAVPTPSPGNFLINVTLSWPIGAPPGIELWWQYWVPFDDGAAVSGVAASNAVRMTSP